MIAVTNGLSTCESRTNFTFGAIQPHGALLVRRSPGLINCPSSGNTLENPLAIAQELLRTARYPFWLAPQQDWLLIQRQCLSEDNGKCESIGILAISLRGKLLMFRWQYSTAKMHWLLFRIRTSRSKQRKDYSELHQGVKAR